MIYKVVKRLIALGRTDGLAEKVDVYFLSGRITREEYQELMNLLEGEGD